VQLLDSREDVIGLGQDDVFELRLVGDEGILQPNAGRERPSLSKRSLAMRAAISAP